MKPWGRWGETVGFLCLYGFRPSSGLSDERLLVELPRQMMIEDSKLPATPVPALSSFGATGLGKRRHSSLQHSDLGPSLHGANQTRCVEHPSYIPKRSSCREPTMRKRAAALTDGAVSASLS